MSCPACHSNRAKNKPRPPAVHPPEHLRMLQRVCRSRAGTARAPPPTHGKPLHFIELTNVAPKRRGYLGSGRRDWGGGCFLEGGRNCEQSRQTFSWKEKPQPQTSPEGPNPRMAHTAATRVALLAWALWSMPGEPASVVATLSSLCSTNTAEGSLGWEPRGWALVPALPPALGMT